MSGSGWYIFLTSCTTAGPCAHLDRSRVTMQLNMKPWNPPIFGDANVAQTKRLGKKTTCYTEHPERKSLSTSFHLHLCCRQGLSWFHRRTRPSSPTVMPSNVEHCLGYSHRSQWPSGGGGHPKFRNLGCHWDLWDHQNLNPQSTVGRRDGVGPSTSKTRPRRRGVQRIRPARRRRSRRSPATCGVGSSKACY